MNHLPYFHMEKSWNLPDVCGEKLEEESWRKVHFNIYSENLKEWDELTADLRVHVLLELLKWILTTLAFLFLSNFYSSSISLPFSGNTFKKMNQL